MPARHAHTSSARGRFAACAAGIGAVGVASAFALAPGAQATPHAQVAATAQGSTERGSVEAPAAPQPTVTTTEAAIPNFGLQKVRVGVKLADGSVAPAGYSLADATLQLTETGDNAPTPATEPCTTGDDGYCQFGDNASSQHVDAIRPAEPDDPSYYIIGPGDSLKITQTKAPTGPGLLIDTESQTIPACINPIDDDVAGARAAADPVYPECPPSTPPAQARAGLRAASTVTAGCTGAEIPCSNVLFDDPGLPPLAVKDSATDKSGQPVTISVQTNDNLHAVPLTGFTTTQPAHGKAVLDGTKIVYTSTDGYFGTDTFTYTIKTGNGSSTATVTVTVLAPPLAVNDSAKTSGAASSAGTPVDISVLSNDQIRGTDPVTITHVGDAAHGTVTTDGTTITYTPDAGFSGADAFPYTISNSVGSSTATVTVIVTLPPLANTGVESGQLLGLGGVLLLVGGGATAAGRRRRVRA